MISKQPPRAALFAVQLVALSLASSPPAQAQPADFAGRWVIAKAAMAPWADGVVVGGPEEEKRLLGKTVTLGPRAVTAPQPVGCKPPVYTVRDDPPDMLFEGGLAEPDKAGKPRNAVALARALGMSTRTVRTLEIGCSEISFHRFAPDTLVFGLDNRVYTLHRAAKGK
ncbi:MAG: hypothetical protein ABIO39_14100 [Caulobacteraceae bacterium]